MSPVLEYIFIRHNIHHNIDDHPGENVETVETRNAIKITAESNRSFGPDMQFVQVNIADELLIGHGRQLLMPKTMIAHMCQVNECFMGGLCQCSIHVRMSRQVTPWIRPHGLSDDIQFAIH